jgi:hypothetical protein
MRVSEPAVMDRGTGGWGLIAGGKTESGGSGGGERMGAAHPNTDYQ